MFNQSKLSLFVKLVDMPGGCQTFTFTTRMASCDTFAVNYLCFKQVSLKFNKKEAKPADNVTVTVKAHPGSMVNLLAVDQSVLLLKGGNDITQEQVIIYNNHHHS